MDIPAFSIFSAVSELLVTAIVLYVVVANLRGRPFAWRLLGVALVFEVCVNVVYMIRRAAAAEAQEELSSGLAALFAIHGILSLMMLMGLILAYLVATFDEKARRRTWFQQHPAMTWGFIALWVASVGSGEAAFVWRYMIAA
jgi:hypothetical protein